MAETAKKVFYRRAIPFGNSAGILLPKALLGADVRVLVINPPRKIKRDSMRILEPILENILGIYVVSNAKKRVEILAISININRHMNRGAYEIDVVPLDMLKKSLKEKTEIRDNIKKAKVVINAKLLSELKKEL